MIIDGTALAEQLKTDLRARLAGRTLVMGVILVGDDPVSRRYVERKQAFGASIGIEVRLFGFPADIAADDLISEVKRLDQNSALDGLIVQVPLPPQIDTDAVAALIGPNKDIDALGPEARIDSPVVRAVEFILKRAGAEVAGRQAVVVGYGKLVGQPIARWLIQSGAMVEIVDENTKNTETLLGQADVVVLGAGKPGLVRPEMLKPGVVLIDAATSESSGKLAGDALPACAEVASVFTPVPGGVGPLTVAMLFQNLIDLNS